MKKTILILSLIAGAVKLTAQMGARIEQFYMDPSISIPAAIGTDEKGSVALYYNKIFSETPGSPQHTLLNVSMPVKNKNTAFGLMYLK